MKCIKRLLVKLGLMSKRKMLFEIYKEDGDILESLLVTDKILVVLRQCILIGCVVLVGSFVCVLLTSLEASFSFKISSLLWKTSLVFLTFIILKYQYYYFLENEFYPSYQKNDKNRRLEFFTGLALRSKIIKNKVEKGSNPIFYLLLIIFVLLFVGILIPNPEIPVLLSDLIITTLTGFFLETVGLI